MDPRPRFRADRTLNIVESVIREMTRLAARHNAVNLAQGFPDFPAPQVLKQAAADAIAADVNQYAITWGAKSFRDAIAAKYHVTVAEIRWSNSNLYSSDTVATGDQIVIPPVHGVVVTTKSSDTIESLATKYSVDPQAIVDFNRLRTTQLVGGTTLVIPGGVGGAFPPPPALYQILAQTGHSSSFPVQVLNCCLGPFVNNKFPVGWCTYYVATKRNVTWNGDAGYWYANASAQGYAVGPTPKVGSIMVTWESWAGHVAYVEAVNPDGSWVVSEMNWVAFDVIDQRTIKPGQLGSKLVGFIY